MTLSEENYLKTIFHSSENNSEVSTNAIAEAMNTKASSVTDMLKKLSEKELLNYKPYRGVSLTPKGRKLALSIIRKHRLWEVFLVEKLNFSWDEVHDIAEELEHIKSDKLINRLDAFLNFPETDPHGDPIPSRDGELEPIKKSVLSELQNNETAICVGVKNTDKDFLLYLNKLSLALGDEIKVISKEKFDQSMVIEIHKKKVSLSASVCRNIYVQKQQNHDKKYKHSCNHTFFVAANFLL